MTRAAAPVAEHDDRSAAARWNAAMLDLVSPLRPTAALPPRLRRLLPAPLASHEALERFLHADVARMSREGLERELHAVLTAVADLDDLEQLPWWCEERIAVLREQLRRSSAA